MKRWALETSHTILEFWVGITLNTLEPMVEVLYLVDERVQKIGDRAYRERIKQNPKETL